MTFLGGDCKKLRTTKQQTHLVMQFPSVPVLTFGQQRGSMKTPTWHLSLLPISIVRITMTAATTIAVSNPIVIVNTFR